MPVPTLQDMARRACSRYVRNLHDIGQCPIALIAGTINKIDNPSQLRQLEENSPQVIGHTREAWINLIKRDIPDFERRLPEDWRSTIFATQNGDRWWKVYEKLKRQVGREAKEQDKMLLDTLKGIREARGEGAKVVNKPLAAGVGASRYRNANWNLNKDLYASKASGGASFFDKLNRNAVSKASARMRTPTHKLKPVFNKEVKKAPMSLVEDMRIRKENEEQARMAKEQAAQAAQNHVKRIRPPQGNLRTGALPPLHAPAHLSGDGYDLVKDREARLRNLKAGKTTNPGQTSTSPSNAQIARLTEDFLEDDDDGGGNDSDGNDDLFGSAKPAVQLSGRLDVSPMPQRASPLKTAPRTAAQKMVKKNKDPPTLFRPVRR